MAWTRQDYHEHFSSYIGCGAGRRYDSGGSSGSLDVEFQPVVQSVPFVRVPDVPVRRDVLVLVVVLLRPRYTSVVATVLAGDQLHNGAKANVGELPFDVSHRGGEVAKAAERFSAFLAREQRRNQNHAASEEDSNGARTQRAQEDGMLPVDSQGGRTQRAQQRALEVGLLPNDSHGVRTQKAQ